MNAPFPLRPLGCAVLAALAAATAGAQVKTVTDGETWVPLAGRWGYGEIQLDELVATGSLPLYQPGRPSGPRVALAIAEGDTSGGHGGGQLFMAGATLNANVSFHASTGQCPGPLYHFQFGGSTLLQGHMAVQGSACRGADTELSVSAVNGGQFAQRVGNLELRTAGFVNMGDYRIDSGLEIRSSGEFLDDPGAGDAPLPAFVNHGQFIVEGEAGTTRVTRLNNGVGGGVLTAGVLELQGGVHQGWFESTGGGRLDLAGQHRIAAGGNAPVRFAGATRVLAQAQIGIDPYAQLVVDGTTVLHGRIEGEGELSVAAPGVLLIGPTGQVVTSWGGGGFRSHGRVVVQAGGRVTTETFWTTGQLTILEGGHLQGQDVLVEGGSVQVDGALGLRDGWDLGSVWLQAARLSGRGGIEGDVLAHGARPASLSSTCGDGLTACIEPGSTLGRLTIDGAVQLGSGAMLVLQVTRDGDGLLAWDRLTALSLTTEPGSLVRIEVDPLALDGLAHTLALVQCGSFGCSFEAALLEVDGPGRVGFDGHGLWLELPAVPEPAPLPLLLAGGMVLAWLRGRRRAT